MPSEIELSEVGIANLALSYIGISEQIQTFDEKSKPAIAASMHYAFARDTLLRSLAWPFAEKYIALAQTNDPLLPDNSQPFPGWNYSYGYPGDCHFARQVCDSGGTRMRYVQMDALYYDLLLYMPPHVPFKVAYSEAQGGRVILTDLSNAYLIYTRKIDDPTQFDPSFALAVAGELAMRMAPMMRVEAGLVTNAIAMRNQAIREAQTQAYNEAREDPEPPSRSVQARL